MLSRLKGIETRAPNNTSVPHAPLALDMLSRLKGIETGVVMPPAWTSNTPLDMLSRLKGIETCIPCRCDCVGCDLRFGYAFPFEGN